MTTSNNIITKIAYLDDITMDYLYSSPLLSTQVIEEAKGLPNNRKKQFLACRLLLAQLLAQYFAIPILPTLVIGINNRPHFEDISLPDFNISHSGHVIAVAIATKSLVGLDIEQNRARDNYLNVVKNYFSIGENKWIVQQAEPLNAFWKLWTLRESALKLHAKGVWQMKEIAIEPDNLKITAKFARHFYCHYQQIGDIHLSINCDQAIDNFICLEY